MTVELTVPEWIFKLLPEHTQDGDEIEVHPVLYTQGVNEMQSMAHMKRSSDVEIQDRINKKAVNALTEYLELLQDFEDEWNPEEGELDIMKDAVGSFKKSVEGSAMFEKSTDILLTARRAIFVLHGGRTTSCKSAKDRTSMSTTLECWDRLRSSFQLKADDRQRFLDLLRLHGTRLTNCWKSTGKRFYAFNTMIQRPSLPEEYRPPVSVCGSVES